MVYIPIFNERNEFEIKRFEEMQHLLLTRILQKNTFYQFFVLTNHYRMFNHTGEKHMEHFTRPLTQTLSTNLGLTLLLIAIGVHVTESIHR